MRLVVYVDGELADLVAMLTGVVGAEEQFAAGLETYSEVGLSPTTITAIDRGQWLTRGSCGGHVRPPLLHGHEVSDPSDRVHSSYLTEASPQTFPRVLLP